MALSIKQYDDESSEIEGDTCIVIYDFPEEEDPTRGDSDYIIAQLSNDAAKDLIWNLMIYCELNEGSDIAQVVRAALADYAAVNTTHHARPQQLEGKKCQTTSPELLAR